MTLLRRLASVLRWLLQRDRAEQDLNDELQAFVDMMARELEYRWIEPARALAATKIERLRYVA